MKLKSLFLVSCELLNIFFCCWRIIISFSKAVVQRCSVKKMFLEISRNSQENTCARESISLRRATLLKKRFWHRCFPVNFVKFRRTPFFHRTPLVTTYGFSIMVLNSWHRSSFQRLTVLYTGIAFTIFGHSKESSSLSFFGVYGVV